MSATKYTAINAWSANARYLAAADIDVKLINPSKNAVEISYSTTMSTTAPTIGIDEADTVEPADAHAFTLKSGEYLWMASLGMLAAVAVLET